MRKYGWETLKKFFCGQSIGVNPPQNRENETQQTVWSSTKQGVVLAGAEQLTFTWELEPESEVQQFANRVTKYVCKKVYQPSETAPPRMCCACWMDVALGGAGWTGGPVRVGEQFLKKPKTES